MSRNTSKHPRHRKETVVLADLHWLSFSCKRFKVYWWGKLPCNINCCCPRTVYFYL